ncbi:unnamed protein product [Cylicocyclus nassatus]|uniref:Uncharacterized protein n=1 Tax=Cylicocyclus nassatus TaxID=53992 RepID=A0AA36GWH6_CYLNA|nr:unnamed protein product [Cylicocyclus nassatus]
MLPLSIFETLCYAIFSLNGGIVNMYHEKFSTLTYRIEITAAYIVPYYTLLSPLILSYVIRRADKLRVAQMKRMTSRKDEQEAYAHIYTQMWNRPIIK